MKKLFVAFMLLFSINSFADFCLTTYAETPYRLENKINELVKDRKVKQIEVFYANGYYTAVIIFEGNEKISPKYT